MKKALSMALTLALTTSAFAGIAGVAAADLNTQDKFKVLFDAGIFAGVNGQAAVDKTLTRAELAVILAKLNGKTQDAAASTFVDVAANHWAKGWIGAAKSASLLLGNDKNQFLPANTVTYQDVAAGLSKAKGLTEATTTTVTGTAVWAKGWVQTALDAGLILPQTDYTKTATRGDLIDATYLVYQASQKVSVTEAKATGVKAVTVVFSKAVDTDKAKLALKNGNVDVKTTSKFAEDKKSAVLTLEDVKIGDGNYSVTLSGLEANAVDKTVANFVGQKEQVKEIKFVNDNERIAKSNKVVVKLKATNQYGEVTSEGAGSFTAIAPSEYAPSLAKNSETGELELKLDTSKAQSELTIVPVTVFFNNSTVTVQKSYKVGTSPFTTKIQLGEVKYPAGKTYISSANDNATVSITQIDQYGDVIPADATVDSKLTGTATISSNTSVYAPEIKTAFDTDVRKLTISLEKGVEKSGEYNVTIYVGSAMATTKVNVKSAKVATKAEFAPFGKTVAAGDTNVYVPIVLYDADGNKLTADEIVDNFKEKRFSFGGYEGLDVVQGVEHKGELVIPKVADNTQLIYLTLGINTANVQSNVQLPITVSAKRLPNDIVLEKKDSAVKGLANSSTEFKWFVKDQYGEKLDAAVADYKVQLTVTGSTYAAVTSNVYESKEIGDVKNLTVSNELFNKGFTLKAKAVNGTTAVEATLINPKDQALKTVKQSFKVVDGTEKLTYSLKEIKTLYATLDNSVAKKVVEENGVYASPLAKTIELVAKDVEGNVVALPDGMVKDTVSAVPSIVTTNGVNGIIGNKAGTTTVSVYFTTATGTQADLTASVTVKADALAVDKITAKATVKSPTNIANAAEIKIVDNYGNEYKEGNIAKYDALLGVRYIVTSVSGGVAGDVVTVNAKGEPDYTKAGKITSYTVKVVTNNAKSVEVVVEK